MFMLPAAVKNIKAQNTQQDYRQTLSFILPGKQGIIHFFLHNYESRQENKQNTGKLMQSALALASSSLAITSRTHRPKPNLLHISPNLENLSFCSYAVSHSIHSFFPRQKEFITHFKAFVTHKLKPVPSDHRFSITIIFPTNGKPKLSSTRSQGYLLLQSTQQFLLQALGKPTD
jgi:hypothetical protein